ncbi:MAG: ABC transporter ATP-binding protein [Oscillospiraceae bacterium]|nr:ABC transporter ATP-binding protein [Oscillospiraceae bacterium]
MNQNKKRSRSLLGTFLSYFKRHKGLFALDMSCALLIAVIDLAFPLVSRTAMYQWLPERKFTVFFVVMAIVVAAFVLRAGLYFVVGYWGHTFGIRVEADIRRDLFEHMQELGFDFYDRNRTGQLMSRLTTDLFELTELSHHGPEDLFISLVTIVGALVVMFTIRWELALVVMCIIPLLLIVVMYRRRQMSAAAREAKQKTGTINAEIESSLSGVRTTKAFANEEEQQRRFDGANNVFKTAKRGFHREMGLFMASMEFFVNILSVAVIAVGGWLIMKDRMNYIDLITFSLYISTFVSPVRKLANFAEMFSSGFAGLKRFAELMDTQPSIQDAPDAVELKNVEGRVTVDHVSFTYDEETEVLHDVSLDVAPGETIAVVGPSGGGKSTLCQLIPRFYEVSAGSISVDGTDVRRLTQASLRRSIGIVQQDVFLFADTVRENIRFGRPDATDEEVAQAARKAEIYDDIMAMPHGFDTYVGERGTLLSGGQKQRVAIARIFLKNPPILILDEATSALDSVTESRIQHAFDELAAGRTTLIIAHRLSTIRKAHRILVIQDGVIAEQGTHEELLAKNGAYARLYHTQNLGELH